MIGQLILLRLYGMVVHSNGVLGSNGIWHIRNGIYDNVTLE